MLERRRGVLVYEGALARDLLMVFPLVIITQRNRTHPGEVDKAMSLHGMRDERGGGPGDGQSVSTLDRIDQRRHRRQALSNLQFNLVRRPRSTPKVLFEP